jgi:hypothetical protein
VRPPGDVGDRNLFEAALGGEARMVADKQAETTGDPRARLYL